MLSAGVEVLDSVRMGPRGGRFGIGVTWHRNRPPAHTSGRAFLQLGQLGELFEGHRTHGLGGLHVRLHLFQIPLELGPPVLKPSDHLCVGQAELMGDLVPVRWAQVFLVQEALFQLVDLLVGERRAGFPPLFWSISLAEERQTVSA